MKLRDLATTFALLVCPLIASASDWIEKTSGDGWTWGEDYVYAVATYQVACEPKRQCEVGAGWKIRGKPRGERKVFSGDDTNLVVIGVGALHFRAADGKGPVKFAFRQKDSHNISWTVDW